MLPTFPCTGSATDKVFLFLHSHIGSLLVREFLQLWRLKMKKRHNKVGLPKTNDNNSKKQTFSNISKRNYI